MSPPRFLGEKHPNAKLTAAQVKEVFGLLATGRWPSRRLAKRYGVSEAAIDKIRGGDNWGSEKPKGWKKPRLLTKAGELHSKARLKPKQVLEIRRRAAGGESIVALGAEFGVHYTTIYDIKLGRSWKHLEKKS